MKKFNGKYRIKSSRLPGWDYGRDGIYFVTICTKDRRHYFGNIRNGVMNLSDIGEIANTCWLAIPNHFPFVVLHNHMVMPNHVHGLIEIAKNDNQNTVNLDANTVETQNFASLQKPKTSQPSSYKNKFGPQSRNLSSIIRGFKIGVTKNARYIQPDFKRQPRFHDHIVRNENSYYRIKNYIINNPINWDSDEFNR